MKQSVITFLAFLILAIPFADAARSPDLPDATASSGGTVAFSGVKLTAYSAACRYDSAGGPNGSPSTLPPRSYTVDGSSPVAMVAVPQMGGTKSLVGCFLKLDVSGVRGIPSSIRRQMESKIFFAGDHYGRGSNGMKKMDISYECRPGLQNYTFHNAKVRKLNCVGRNWRTKASKTAVAEMARRITNTGTAVASKAPQTTPPAVRPPNPRGTVVATLPPVSPTRPTAGTGRPRIPKLPANSPPPPASSSRVWIDEAFGTMR